MYPRTIMSEEAWAEAFDAFEGGETIRHLAKRLHIDTRRLMDGLKAINAERYARIVRSKQAQSGQASGKANAGKARRRWGPDVQAPLDVDEEPPGEAPVACRTRADFSASELAQLEQRLKERHPWGPA